MQDRMSALNPAAGVWEFESGDQRRAGGWQYKREHPQHPRQGAHVTSRVQRGAAGEGRRGEGAGKARGDPGGEDVGKAMNFPWLPAPEGGQSSSGSWEAWSALE